MLSDTCTALDIMHSILLSRNLLAYDFQVDAHAFKALHEHEHVSHVIDQLAWGLPSIVLHITGLPKLMHIDNLYSTQSS